MFPVELQQLLLFRCPTVRVDAVEDVASVVIDCSKCSDDAEALAASVAYPRRTRVEGSLDKVLARLQNRHS